MAELTLELIQARQRGPLTVQEKRERRALGLRGPYFHGCALTVYRSREREREPGFPPIPRAAFTEHNATRALRGEPGPEGYWLDGRTGEPS